MGLRRRQWLKLAIGCVAVVTAPLSRLLRRNRTVRCVEAARPDVEPGDARPIVLSEINKPSHWAG